MNIELLEENIDQLYEEFDQKLSEINAELEKRKSVPPNGTGVHKSGQVVCPMSKSVVRS